MPLSKESGATKQARSKMTYDTINDVRTVAGNAEGAFLANRYRIVRQLGQGGMGSVWLAEDTQLDNKLFAIKMLPAILVSNKRAYRQLKDEALVAMQLVHPNIVQIRAFEENDGNPFLVMDYIDGQTLDDYLADHALPLEEAASRRFESVQVGEAASRRFNSAQVGEAASRRFNSVPLGEAASRRFESESDVLRILRPIAAALDYAHAKGVVHRDVKPGNVMIAKDGTPYILDFGIAREIQETMTRVTGKLSSGTLLYMSPEQLMGESPKPAQDVYSFAAMAYECLKGEPPFVRGAIEDQIKNKQPDPLPTELLTGNAAILAAGVMAGLAKKPEARPATCTAVLDGSVFSRKERKDAGAVALVATETGGARLPRPPEPLPGRADAPRPPQGVMWKGVSLAVVLGLAVASGVTWWVVRGDSSRKTARYERSPKAEDKRKTSGGDAGNDKSVAATATTDRKTAKKNPPISWQREKKVDQPVEPPSALNCPTKADVDGIAAEASVQKECLARIDDANGFKVKKDEVSELLVRATSYGKASQWGESAQAFSNYVAKCKALVRLDGERKSALKSKEQAQEAFQTAEAAGAKTYAVSNWNTAVGVWRQASNQFSQMDFSQAGQTFLSAAEHFRKCGDVVKAARANEAATPIQRAENVLMSFLKSLEEIKTAEVELDLANLSWANLHQTDARGVTQNEVDNAKSRIEAAKQAMAHARDVLLNQCSTAPLSVPLRCKIEDTCRAYYNACLDMAQMQTIFTDDHPNIVSKGDEIRATLSSMKDLIGQAQNSLATIRQAPDALTALERDIFTFEFFTESIPQSLQQRLGFHYEVYYKACAEKRTLLKTYTEEHPAVSAAASRADAALAAFKETLRAYKAGEQSSAPKHPDIYVVQPGDTIQGIAARFYGSRSKWRDIQSANMATVSSDGRVRVGQVLKLPNVSTVSATSDLQPGFQPSITAKADLMKAEAEFNRAKLSFERYRNALGKGGVSKEAVAKAETDFKTAEARLERAKKLLENRSSDWPKTGDTKTIALPGGATMEMIYCGPGTFVMGSSSTEEGRSDNESQHRVTLTKGFWLGKYEVTQEQWKSVMGTNPSHFKGEKHPIESVSWDDCQLFIQRVNATLNYGARLPTEAEWEYACRAGTTGAYGGNGDLNDMGWYDANSGGETHCVGQKQPNAWGFHDMHGNVSEWCNDWYEYSYGGDTTDPKGPASASCRAVRGGSWFFIASCCRSARRFGNCGPASRSQMEGFRLCCSAEPRE